MASNLRSLHRPVTLDARFTIACDQCDFAADSAATTPEDAAADLARRHKHHAVMGGVVVEVPKVLTAAAVDYKAHPLFQGRFEHADAKREREQPKEGVSR